MDIPAILGSLQIPASAAPSAPALSNPLLGQTVEALHLDVVATPQMNEELQRLWLATGKTVLLVDDDMRNVFALSSVRTTTRTLSASRRPSLAGRSRSTDRWVFHKFCALYPSISR